MLKSTDLAGPPGAFLYPSSGDRRGYMDPGHPDIRPSLRAQCLLSLSSSRRPVTRHKRQMVPPEKKDAAYLSKRLKNNEAARRSREKRRMKDLLLEGQLLTLSDENAHLRDQVIRLRYLSMCVKKDNPASGREFCALYSPAVSKAPMLGENERNPGILPAFSWAPRFDSLPQSSGLLPPEARVPSAVAGMQRCVEADTDAPIKAAGGAFVPRLDAFHPAPMLPYPSTAWLVPSPAVGSHFTLPWLSPLLASTAPYPSLPVCMQETQGQRVALGGDVPAASRSCFNGALTPRFTSHA